MAINSEIYTAPMQWACYLIYGDCDGMEESEIAACDSWLESIGNPICVDVETIGFSHYHDADSFFPYGGEIAEYTFHILK